MKNNIQISAICPRVCLADTNANAKNIIKLAKLATQKGAQIVTTPELSLTGSTCGDLFLKPLLINNALKSLNTVLKGTKKLNTALIVGLPLQVHTQIIDASAVLYKGKILGIVPADNCETRYFTPAEKVKQNKVSILGQKVPLGNLVFKLFNTSFTVKVGFDLNKQIPPTLKAKIIFNPASNYEYLGKQEKLETLISKYSAKQNCIYVYASSAYGESSAEAVYSASILIYNKGLLVKKAPRLTMKEQIVNYTIGEKAKIQPMQSFKTDAKHPFSPSNKQELLEVLDLQALALARRLDQTKINKVILGISGGLDSTLALLAAVHTFKKLNLPLKNIFAYTLPGLGTTKKTKNNAELLCKALGAE